MQSETIKYVFDKGWRTLLMDMKVREVDVLVKAGLPRDLLTRRSPTVTAAEYFQFWHALEFVMRDEPAFPLRLMQTVAVESLGPPMFACFSCANLNVALSRVAHYKPLVGPIKLDVTQTESYTTVAFCGLDTTTSVPYSLIATELVFWVHISRLATRETIQPHAVFTTVDLPGRSAYEDFFGKPVQRGEFNGLTFTSQDAKKPFLTMNEEMWAIFEPQLNLRMSNLDQGSRFSDRVRVVLRDAIASGHYSKPEIASRLGISARTLQRRLREEGTTYRVVLDKLREDLALRYLAQSHYTSAQIGFLLGYDDPNSFFRAFRSWTGQTPEEVRATIT